MSREGGVEAEFVENEMTIIRYDCSRETCWLMIKNRTESGGKRDETSHLLQSCRRWEWFKISIQ